MCVVHVCIIDYGMSVCVLVYICVYDFMYVCMLLMNVYLTRVG